MMGKPSLLALGVALIAAHAFKPLFERVTLTQLITPGQLDWAMRMEPGCVFAGMEVGF